jgi:phenylacetate-CoA ligase
MLRIPLEESSMELREALLFRSGRVAGYRPWKRTVVIYPESPKIRFYERGRKVFIPSSEDERHVVSMLEKFEPNLIVTFPSTASILAEIVEERKLRHIRPEHIITTGELLTPGKRRFIESAFGCDIYDQYGAEEVGEIAWECGMHDGLHISVDSVIVESVDGSGSPMASGEAGDILLTGLSNRAMPFIRYSIGDSGRMKDGMCACGRGLPLMEMLEGRDDEFLRLSSGRLLGPRVICAILDKLVLFNDIVADFKVVQKRDGRITVYVTEGERFSTSAPLKIKSAMKNAISEPADVDVVVMKEMPRLKGGKFKFIVSEAVRRKNKF